MNRITTMTMDHPMPTYGISTEWYDSKTYKFGTDSVEVINWHEPNHRNYWMVSIDNGHDMRIRDFDTELEAKQYAGLTQ